MGRGPSRKESDQPMVRIAKPKLLVLPPANVDISFTPDQCPVTLQKKLNKSTLTVQNVPVDLKRNGERYDLLIGGSVVGSMNIILSKTITGCGELGIKYKGKIIVENEIVYARFQRTA